MSIRHVHAVLHKVPGKPSGKKLVALVLAEHVHEKDERCWPSYRLIARLAGINERTAKTYVAELIRDGIVERVDRGGVFADPNTGRQLRRANCYEMKLAKLDALPEVPEPKDTREERAVRRKIAASLARSQGGPGCPRPHPTAAEAADRGGHPAGVSHGTPRQGVAQDTGTGLKLLNRKEELEGEARAGRNRGEREPMREQEYGAIEAEYGKAVAAQGVRQAREWAGRCDPPRIISVDLVRFHCDAIQDTQQV